MLPVMLENDRKQAGCRWASGVAARREHPGVLRELEAWRTLPDGLGLSLIAVDLSSTP